MSVVEYLGQYLCPSYKLSVNISEVMIEIKQYKNRRKCFSCVAYICTLGLENAISPFVCRVIIHPMTMEHVCCSM